MRRFNINEKCNGCGVCITLTNLLIESDSGQVYPSEVGYISDEFLLDAQNIVLVCPVKAISIIETGNIKSTGSEGLKELENLLIDKLKKIEKPSVIKHDIKFDASEYNIDYADERGFQNYNYSSDGQAENAALEEFNRIAYSQFRPFILSVFVQYKNAKLKPYYTFDSNSFYFNHNKKYEKVLNEIVAEAMAISNNTILLQNDFAKFDVHPGGSSKLYSEVVTYKLENFEMQSTQSGVMSEFNSSPYSSLNSYKTYIDTDDMEIYEGEDWRGNSKYKTKYCYRPVCNAVNEYIKDLKNAMNYADIGENAFDFLKDVLNSYEKEIEKEIQLKIDIFSKIISNK